MEIYFISLSRYLFDIKMSKHPVYKLKIYKFKGSCNNFLY